MRPVGFSGSDDMKKVVLAISFAICSFTGFAASTPPKVIEADLRAAATSLKDPDSAKFKDIRFIAGDAKGEWEMCGLVNAKNSYGAYGGFQTFIGTAFTNDRKKPTYVFIAVGETADQMCEKRAIGRDTGSKKQANAVTAPPFEWPAVPASVIEQK